MGENKKKTFFIKVIFYKVKYIHHSILIKINNRSKKVISGNNRRITGVYFLS